MKKSELWVITREAQYRLRGKKVKDKIRLTFWLHDGQVHHFNTNYKNLFEMLNSANKKLYDTKA